MPRAVSQLLERILILVALQVFGGCAIFGGSEDEPVKNTSVKVAPPQAPFEEVRVSDADRVWQSRKTGNTIAYNSACLENLKEDLGTLEKRILSGVDNIKILSQIKLTVDGAPAERTRAEGKTDGVPISIDLVTIKKSNCTYDLAYVTRVVTFAVEQNTFQQFVERFHTP
jgi:hypothetical protein